MDDRILLIDVGWISPAARRHFPGVLVVYERLGAFLPTDEFAWPFHRPETTNRAWEDTLQRFQQSVTPQHHVVDMRGWGGETFLLAIARAGVTPRSVVLAGFYPRVRALREAGWSEAAAGAAAYYRMATNPGQILGSVTNIGELERAAISEELQRDVDFRGVHDYHMGPPQEDLSQIGPLNCPALYLSLPGYQPAREHHAELLRQYLPQLEVGSLQIHGLDLKDEAGGHELADKVIPFLQKSIVRRGDG